MNVETYFSDIMAGFEFLIALGSLIGLFGLAVGAIDRILRSVVIVLFG